MDVMEITFNYFVIVCVSRRVLGSVVDIIYVIIKSCLYKYNR
jgi:hypothetical protein